MFSFAHFETSLQLCYVPFGNETLSLDHPPELTDLFSVPIVLLLLGGKNGITHQVAFETGFFPLAKCL